MMFKCTKLMTSSFHLFVLVLVGIMSLKKTNSLGLVQARCPGSKAAVHAECNMQIVFPATECSVVQDEMTRRIDGENGWLDPHNRGVYTLTRHTTTSLSASRLTGDKKYTDLFEFTFAQAGADCMVEACSESQVTSVLDFSTNYCNLHNLYCSYTEGCSVVKHELEYTETYDSCRQRDVGKCLASIEATA